MKTNTYKTEKIAYME